jgi:hypothetical protein
MWVIGNMVMLSQGQLTNVGMPASLLGMGLTTLRHKQTKKTCYEMAQRDSDLDKYPRLT